MDRIWRAVEDATDGPLEDAIDQAAEDSMRIGGEAMGRDLGLQVSFDVSDPNVARHLDQLGARRVTGINRETRRQLQTILSRAAEEGTSYQRVEREIRERFDGMAARQPQLHVGSRAELIALTETADAYGSAQAIAADDLAANGVETVKYWLTAGGNRVCPTCEPNGAQGRVARGEPFESGHFREPAHPACRCAVSYRPVRGAPDPQSVLPGLSTFQPA